MVSRPLRMYHKHYNKHMVVSSTTAHLLLHFCTQPQISLWNMGESLGRMLARHAN